MTSRSQDCCSQLLLLVVPAGGSGHGDLVFVLRPERGQVEAQEPLAMGPACSRAQCAMSTGKFLADNIVGSVLVFSLLFWIPFSILVHCVVSPHAVWSHL